MASAMKSDMAAHFSLKCLFWYTTFNGIFSDTYTLFGGLYMIWSTVMVNLEATQEPRCAQPHHATAAPETKLIGIRNSLKHHRDRRSIAQRTILHNLCGWAPTDNDNDKSWMGCFSVDTTSILIQKKGTFIAEKSTLIKIVTKKHIVMFVLYI